MPRARSISSVSDSVVTASVVSATSGEGVSLSLQAASERAQISPKKNLAVIFVSRKCFIKDVSEYTFAR